jgi:hypothetical protein
MVIFMGTEQISEQLHAPTTPLMELSPDQQYVAIADEQNTVIIHSTKGVYAQYFGHQEGVYRLSGRVTSLCWDRSPNDSANITPWIITSTSSTGSTHRWNLQGIHLETVQPAKIFTRRGEGLW